MKDMKIGIIGSGAMGSGIAQVAAQSGHQVVLIDTSQNALDNSRAKLAKVLARLVEKGRIKADDQTAIQSRISYSENHADLAGAGLVIEAIVERLDVKQSVFQSVENYVDDRCILATNTSSLSVAAIAAACKIPSRVLGIHFFNPSIAKLR